MDYNTTREHLVIREYGRHVQNLIAHAKTIEDKEERQNVVNGIIQLMGHLNPHLRNVVDFKHKLWDHLFMIGGFDLDVDSPYEKPTEEIAKPKPGKVPYPGKKMRFRHYGRNVEAMVEKARKFPDREMRQGLTEVVVNFMKMAYHNWSKEEVSDDLIKSDLATLSEGTLVVDDDMNMEAFVKAPIITAPVRSGRSNSRSNRNSGGRGKQRNSGGSRGGGRRR